MINTNYRTPYYPAYRVNKPQKLSFSGLKEDYAENERKTISLYKDLTVLSKSEKLSPENVQKAVNKYTDNIVVKDMDKLSYEEKQMLAGYDAIAQYLPNDKTVLLINFSTKTKLPEKALIPLIGHEFMHGLQYLSSEYKETYDKTLNSGNGLSGILFSAIEQSYIYPAINIKAQKNNNFDNPQFKGMHTEINNTFGLYGVDKKTAVEYFKLRSVMEEQAYKVESKAMERNPDKFSQDEIIGMQTFSKTYSDFNKFLDKI